MPCSFFLNLILQRKRFALPYSSTAMSNPWTKVKEKKANYDAKPFRKLPMGRYLRL